jgi:hypothetical protein
MICRVCGRKPQKTFTRRYSFLTIHGRFDFFEPLCWRCFSWSDPNSPAFGRLYATR